MSRYYIGLATSIHDPALAIIGADGEVLFAESTERYLQNKRAWQAAPDDFIHVARVIRQYCEPGAELVIASSWSDAFNRRLDEGFRQDEAPVLGRDGVGIPRTRDKAWQHMMRRYVGTRRFYGANVLWHLIPPGALRSYRVVSFRDYAHHETHAAYACMTSPFDRAACAVIDAYGEGTSTMCFRYGDGRLERIAGHDRVEGTPASLGMYYANLCEACGFDPYRGEEWKVMGLAPYGVRDDAWYALLRNMFRTEGCELAWGAGSETASSALGLAARKAIDRPPLESANLAFTGQLVFEEVAAELLTNLHAQTGLDDLVLGGGCALNSVFNGKITSLTPWKRVYVPSAPADDGNAIGAALLALREDRGERARAFLSPYLGSTMSREALGNLERLGKVARRLPDGESVSRFAAERLAAGKIVGWVQGRAEFGPRALGARSILADPRSPDIKEIINARVKFREEFRPFAPAILVEHAGKYFENYEETPYMERALRFRPEMASKVPGVVHHDGTGRLQTVRREWNQRYYDLIARFYELTGVPVVLNTSFNVMGKPIIHSVEDAVAVFYTTGLDVLCIEDLVLEKA